MSGFAIGNWNSLRNRHQCHIHFVSCRSAENLHRIFIGKFCGSFNFLNKFVQNSIILCVSSKKQTSGGSKYLMLTPDRCLIFPSVDYVKNLVNKLGAKSQVPVVIDCTHIYGADFTAATVIETLVADFSARNQMLIFYNLKPSVGQVFEGVVDIDLTVQYDLASLERAIDERKS